MSWRTGRRFPWVLTVSSNEVPLMSQWTKWLLAAFFLSLIFTGCTPGMFFDLLERVTETTEQACHRAGGEFILVEKSQGPHEKVSFHYECKK